MESFRRAGFLATVVNQNQGYSWFVSITISKPVKTQSKNMPGGVENRGKTRHASQVRIDVGLVPDWLKKLHDFFDWLDLFTRIFPTSKRAKGFVFASHLMNAL